MSQLEPSTAKGQTTRARIVQAAAELVAEKGAAAMSLDDVGARGQASRSQLYHYFDDRDDLIRAVVSATTDSVLLAQDELLDHLDTWAGIDRWFRALIALQEQREARGGCPIGSLVGQLAERDPLARAALADGFERWERHLRDGLERMQARGRLSATADPARLATATMALLQGGLLLTQVRRDPKQLRTALDAARVLLRSAAT
ncbi:MAG TPA: TetR family transcriptional regulator [Solirubrobacteraceae bacterium]|nr:TetR family transcriptional regulator [Solirubrobacteraceae bacterium]